MEKGKEMDGFLINLNLKIIIFLIIKNIFISK
jgi:hypothetical protein